MDEPITASDAPIDLNDVTRKDLERRCGLAPEVAGAIVAFRKEHGPWTSIEQLLEIPGVDSSVLDALRQCVYVTPPREAALPGTAETAPVPEEPLVEQAGSWQPEPAPVAAEPPVAGDGLGCADAFSDEDLLDAPALDDALAVPQSGPEAAPGSDEDERGPIDNPPAAGERAAYQETAEPAAAGPIREEEVSLARKAPAVEPLMEGSPDLGSGATEKREDGEPARSLVEATPAPETPFGPVTGGSESPVTPLPSEPSSARVKLDQAEEPQAVVEARDTPLPTPDYDADLQQDSRLVTETIAMTTAASTAPAPARRRSVWHDVGMIVLGGLVGALLTLVILGGVGGTLTYAPRRLVDALSQNMSIMQDNQETTWSQLQSLSSRADALEARLGALETLNERVVELERDSAAMDAQLGELSGGVDELSASLASLESTHGALIQGLDARVGSQERDLDALGETVGVLSDTVQAMQDLVDKYEAFFDALRDLLIEMQGDTVVESGA